MVYDYDDSELKEYDFLERALERSFSQSEERGEPYTASFAIEDGDDVDDLLAKTQYEHQRISWLDVFYVRYRGRVFEVGVVRYS